MEKYNVSEIFLYKTKNLKPIIPTDGGKLPTVITIAGSDSSGGAGIEADIKTITAHGCYALTAITVLTAQNTTGVFNAVNTTSTMISSIIDTNFSDIPIDSIKTGLLTREAILALKSSIEKFKYVGNLVVDPVMVSTSGFEFVNNELLELITKTLSSHITLITPNMVEAKAIINTLSNTMQYSNDNLGSLEDIFEMCLKIYKLSNIENILIKGGHQKWNDEKLLTDVLYSSKDNKFYVFYSEMKKSKNTHGTGCTLSSAIASNLTCGMSMVNCVANSILYVQNGIMTAPNIGHGYGPLNHIQKIKRYDYESSIDETFSLPFTSGDYLTYLCNHDEIKEVWKEFANHLFISELKNFTLPLEKFRHFCEQHLVYLISCSHAISSISTTNKDEKDIDSTVMQLKLISKEISQYKLFLKKLGCDNTEIGGIKPNEACKDIVDALLDLAKNSGDLLEVFVSLLPYLHGYNIAYITSSPDMENISNPNPGLKMELYKDWLSQCRFHKDTYADSVDERLHSLFISYCTNKVKLEQTVSIFRMFLILNIRYLNTFT